MTRFEGKVAIVTGAASGIGRATTLRLASEGASVFATDVNAEGLAETAGLAKDAGGVVQTATSDVAQRSECFGAVAAAVESFGRLDVLANVAGLLRFTHSHDMAEADWDLVVAVNLSGPFFMSQASIPHLLESGGNIVNVASNAGLMGQAYTAAYCATKGAIVQLTRALAMEYIKQGIRVNAVAPSGTKTNIARGIPFPEDMDPELMGRFRGLRPVTDPSEIAGAIAYLASDEAKSVHGSIFSIDNGVTAG